MPVESLVTFLNASGVEKAVDPTNRLPMEPFPKSVQNQTLVSSTTETVTGNATAVTGLGGYRLLEFELDVTAAATEAGDTLDVFIQTQLDGTNWVDVVHFTQVTGNGGTKRFFAKIVAGLAETMFENGTALGAGSVRHLLGDTFRARWAIVDVATTGNQSFTFSVKYNALA